MKRLSSLCALALLLALTLCAPALAASPFTPALTVNNGIGANVINYTLTLTGAADTPVRLADYSVRVAMPHNAADSKPLATFADNVGLSKSVSPWYIDLTSQTSASTACEQSAYVTRLSFNSGDTMVQKGDKLTIGFRFARADWSAFTNIPANNPVVSIFRGDAQIYPLLPVDITSFSPADGTLGVSYAHTFTATGAPAFTVKPGSGALPAGLTLSAAGVLSGTPTQAGTFSFTVLAENESGGGDEQAVALRIVQPVAITAFVLAGGQVGVGYTHIFIATGAPTFTVKPGSGALPAGLTLSQAGVLSGTPTQGGTFAFTVLAENESGGSDEQEVALRIVQPVAFTSLAPAGGRVGVGYTHTFTASGAPAFTVKPGSGALPAGLTLSQAGVLSGTPTQGGTFSFTVLAENESSGSDEQAVSLTIAAATPAPSTQTPPPPALPPTGDASAPLAWLLALPCALALLCVLIRERTARRR